LEAVAHGFIWVGLTIFREHWRDVQHLKIVIMLDPASPSLSSTLANNPALLSDTTIFHASDLSPAQEVAAAHTAFSDILTGPNASIDADILAELLRGLHACAGNIVAVTPHHFCSITRQCAHIFADKRQALTSEIDFLQVTFLMHVFVPQHGHGGIVLKCLTKQSLHVGVSHHLHCCCALVMLPDHRWHLTNG
jgi:hypothetical protein